ncbi:DUF7666 domain-containing protein, partial [Paraburkholderia phenoliruptrix]|uniref:DUF7666 domain-containing protein n=1 Tax=Paraburkholderia phenoliruptrix TaxID=252970 RepID=UPI00285DB045|nr:hypothetical protein [Paraburkholderia phenoliruptrix]
MTEEKVVVAYKAFNKDLTCRGFQYEIGATYEHQGSVKACKGGFHACENPLDMWQYYPLTDSRFCVVELSGELSRHGNDSKIAAGKIKIKAEIGIPQIVTSAIQFVMDLVKDAKDGDVASGNSSKQAASGDSSTQAASGDSSTQAASGYSSTQAASGDSSTQAASGNSSTQAASGYSSTQAASGDSSKQAASGNSSKQAASGDSSTQAASGDSSTQAASGYS